MTAPECSLLLRSLFQRRNLTAAESAYAVGAIMEGQWTASQASALLAALATKGESVEEVVGAACAMRERGVRVAHALDLVLDVCGTGGDAVGTINVSTCAGLVVAGCGVAVAKHGNRAASSRCGSADVLEAAGARIDGDPEEARTRLERDHFAFLFAPRYHPAMRSVAGVRRELRVRTVFNILGPLTNPAAATHQVVGVALESHVELVGEALQALGARAGAVLHAANGIDEIAGDAPTHVFQFGPSGVHRYVIHPEDYDIRAPLKSLLGSEPAANAAALRSIVGGERSPRADVIALNAALALVIAERAESLREGLALARASIASGAALAVLAALQRPAALECA